MLDREACERRVYRLALVLTGRVRSATAVIEQVLGTRPDLRTLDSAHLDRLTVLRSREQQHSAMRLPGLDELESAALAELSPQQREAWVFLGVYAMDERSTARAMDCSFRAVRQHHEQAVAALRSRIGEGIDALPARLRDALLQVEVPQFFRAARRRHQRTRLTLTILLIAAAALGAFAALSWLAQSLR